MGKGTFEDSADGGNHDVLLTIPQVARRLQLSRAQVYRLMQHGELRSITIGRSRRVKERTLNAFIQALQEE